MNKAKFQMTVQLLLTDCGTRILVLSGRDAWAMHELIRMGERGCTPIDNPAPRWSAYIFNLRKMGVTIETITEPHGGSFAGTHARYVLRSNVTIMSLLDNRGGSHAIRQPF
jgi:hypothetical protein